MKKTYKVCALVAASGAVLATAGPARAANIDCSNSTTVPHPVYIAGSSASQPVLQAIAKVLAGQSPPVSILYSGPSSCLGLEDVVAGQTESNTWKYLDPTTNAADTCVAGSTAFPASYVDIGVSDVFPASCVQPQVTVGSGFKEFHGAIQPMEIVVPWASSENSISQDAAYTVFGFGAEMYQVSPWTQSTAIWIRNPASGTEVMTANAIGLRGHQVALRAVARRGCRAGERYHRQSARPPSPARPPARPTPRSASCAAGTLDPLRGAPGTNDAGGATGGYKPLAFQAKDESCGYYADSDLNHYDKINVRQGRYAIWGPVHFLTNVDGSGNPLASPSNAQNVNPSATADVVTVIKMIQHQGLTVNDPGLKTIITAEASAHFVPDCAMEVARTTEVNLTTSGGEMSYAPTGACGCFFESLEGGGTTTSPYCQTCATSADCADAGVYTHCNYGYCEAQ